jgi:prepilin-type N-terminal cleavage/methylation domain-containing protein
MSDIKHNRMGSSGLSAFTLIELLVVIAIIGILLAILIPSLKEAKKQTQAVICRSNLKQWGHIFNLYAQDNEEKLPQSIAGGRLNAQQAYWIVATLPYYEAKNIRMCPSTRVEGGPVNRQYGSTTLAWGPFDPGTTNDWWADFDAGGYGINDWCAAPPPTPDNKYWGFSSDNAWVTLSARGGNNVPLFLDCVYVDGFPENGDSPLGQNPGDERWNTSWGMWYTQALRLYCIDRHKGGINGVFLDLSAAKIPLKQLWQLKWHKKFNISGWQQAWPDWMQNYKD